MNSAFGMSRGTEPRLKVRDNLSKEERTEVGVCKMKARRWESSRWREGRTSAENPW